MLRDVISNFILFFHLTSTKMSTVSQPKIIKLGGRARLKRTKLEAPSVNEAKTKGAALPSFVGVLSGKQKGHQQH